MSANSAKSTFSFRSDIVSTDNLKAWLAGTFVVADPDHSHLVRVFGDDSAYDAFEALCSNGVSSVPIYDEDQGEYTGIVDMFDIVTLAERHIEREELTADGGEHLTTIRGHDEFRKPVRKVANISKRNPFRPLPNEVSLEQVCKLLVTKGMHRVLITDDDRKHCYGVLTQSWILEWMYGHLDDLGPAVDQTVEELGFASATSITSVNQNDVAFDGFKTLSQAGHSALCVVDDDGAVVGSLSVGDLKAIHSEEHHADFTPLFGTAGEFLTLCQSKGRNTTASNVTCGTDATLRECITRCHNDHLHRLFVVDADGKAVGVVALREMIGALVPSA